MRQIDIRELKLIQIEILDQFDAFCKKNNINNKEVEDGWLR